MVMQLRRWLPQRPLVLVGDNSYAVLDLLHCCQSLREPVTLIARLRLDAALYAPAPARQPGQNGRPALKGPRRLKTLLDHGWASSEVALSSFNVGVDSKEGMLQALSSAVPSLVRALRDDDDHVRENALRPFGRGPCQCGGVLVLVQCGCRFQGGDVAGAVLSGAEPGSGSAG